MNDVSLANLAKTLGYLREANDMAMSASKTPDSSLFRVSRAGTIQNFENAYELSIQVMRKFLAEREYMEMGAVGLDFRGLMRLAAERDLIDDPKVWFKFRDMRNKTSHVYDEKIVNQVFDDMGKFIVALADLLTRMEKLDAASG